MRLPICRKSFSEDTSISSSERIEDEGWLALFHKGFGSVRHIVILQSEVDGKAFMVGCMGSISSCCYSVLLVQRRNDSALDQLSHNLDVPIHY